MYDHTPKQRQRGPIRRLFGAIGRTITWLRIALANLLFIALILFVVLVLMPRAPEPLPDSFALTLAPSGMLVDQRRQPTPMELLFDDGSPPPETQVSDLVDTLHYAAEDERVTGLVMELDGLAGGGISKLEEVGRALVAFRESGKPVVAVGTNFSQQQYYLASYADEIYLHDMGMVLLTGYGAYSSYFKSALDKLHINFHTFQSGAYKSAIEPFSRDDMSDEARANTSQWLNELWGVYTSRVESLRNLPTGAIDDYINNLDQKLRASGGSSARLALESGLVDGLSDHRDIHDQLIPLFGATSGDAHRYRGINHRRYLADIQPFIPRHSDQIGVLVASGRIMDGYQGDGQIGSATMAEQLRSVAENPNIKALVIRVDSPGGSAFASEVIRAEVETLRASGIPVLVSMGSMAASGGYWIAAGADEIWATPTTLTGSIGVFGAIPTFEDSLEHLGIYTDGVGSTALAGATRLDRPLSPQMRDIIQLGVDDIYQRFLVLVAEARGTTPEAVHEVAQGQVWTGASALELGLVDRLGDLNEVIAAAAEHAGLEHYSVEPVSRPMSAREMLLSRLSGSSVGALLPERWLLNLAPPEWRSGLDAGLEPLLMLREFNDPRATYARCLNCTAP
ncbi:signal peptide peptidase SppA [Marinimicrobium alkaliphilum]|uniref:signal peptide peptidase SppA n=1 Tax=Marinimicrobium alkaliphilum TaxID=2202654 RepID=UPI000DBA6A71|nr:signal peptide peptidase SppA [Marinimicrobium alkaliphilum]